MAQTGKHALIFGASGISGWALLNQTLQYPTPTTFNRVTGLCNRPWTNKDAYLPDDQRLNIVSGIDLTQPVETVKAQLKEKVEKVETVDVVFFCGMCLPS
jgi:nucleoside-diphosphate-sugar epimerase